MCEKPFGMAGRLEQSDVAALVAPRALLVISARADGAGFRYEDAAETLEQAARMWQIMECPDKVRFAALPVSHGYPVPARELCLGWLNKWLHNGDSAAPVEEPQVPLEDYRTLACYPDRHCRARGTLLAVGENKQKIISGGADAVVGALARNALLRGMAVWMADLPGVAESELPNECGMGAGYVYMKGAVDALRACHLLGFSLAGYWLSMINALASCARQEVGGCVRLAASGGLSTPVLAGASLLGDVDGMLAFRPLASYRNGMLEAGYLPGGPRDELADRLLPVESMIPGLLKAGDIPDCAALAAPKPLSVIAPKSLQNVDLTGAAVRQAFAPVRDAYDAAGGGDVFHLVEREEADMEARRGFLLDLNGS